MDFEEFLKRVSDYIDKEFEKDFFEEFDRIDEMIEEEFAEMEKFERSMEKEFEEMDKLIEQDTCCLALFNTMKKTIQLCHELEEMEVPQDIHTELFRKLEEIDLQ